MDIGMKQYQITLTGLTPLLLHNDNMSFSENITAWQNDPANAVNSVAGDDRTPAWRWIGYLYHDETSIGVASDNVMTMMREGGSKIKIPGKKSETYKKQTQSGIMIDSQQFDLVVNGSTIPCARIKSLIGETNFKKHIDLAEELCFELNIKRAKIGKAKHVRVRPMFRNWDLVGKITVLDEELSGLTKDVLTMILNQAGALCGIGDWRPSSPSSGTFGKFRPEVEAI
ncbi:MAG: hypothetical protein WA151_13900 [Desulfatirhabdiaceae bacterium]